MSPARGGAAASFFPGEFTLSDGPVGFVETSHTNPKVRMDETGLWATDATGAFIFKIDAALATGFFDGDVQASKILGQLTNAQIADLASGKITGQMIDAQLAAIGATKVTGQLTNAQLQSIAATKVTGQLADSQLAALTASKITGTLVDAQIADLTAAKITGQLTNAQLQAIAAGKITGQLTNTQIADLAAAKITGAIADSQIAALAAAKVTGTLTDAQIAALAAAKITGTLTGAQIAALAVGTTHVADGAITAVKLTVTQLSAITADAGVITAGIIRGAIHETQAANPKVRFDNTGFFMTDAAGNKVLNLDTANGLTFLVDSVIAAPKRVNFVKLSNGLLLGYIQTVATAAHSTQMTLTAQTDAVFPASGEAAVIVQATEAAGTSRISVQARDPITGVNQNKNVLNSDATSDYELWGAWTAFAFNATNWGNNVGSQACQFRVSGDGSVQLRGVAKVTAGPVVVGFGATARIGSIVTYKPPADFLKTQYCNDSSGIKTTVGIDVVPGAGGCDLFLFAELSGRALTGGVGTIVSLDGIEFSTKA